MYSLILDKGQMMPYIGEFDFTFDTYDEATNQWACQEMGARINYDGDGEYIFVQHDTALLGEHIYITLVDDDAEFDYEGNHLTGSAVTFQAGARAGEGYVSYITIESGITLRAFFYKDTMTIYDETSGEQVVTNIEYTGFLFSVTSIEGPVPEIKTYKYACVNSRYYSPGYRDTYDEHELHYHFFERDTTPEDTAWIGPFYPNKYTTYNNNVGIFDFTDETREINGNVYRVVQKRGGDKYFESATTEDTSVIYTYSADTSEVYSMNYTAYIWHTKLNDSPTYNSKPVPGIRYNTTSNAVLFNGRKPVVNVEDGHYSEDVPIPAKAQCTIHATYTWEELGITDEVFDRYVRMFRERRPITEFNVYAENVSMKWILLEYNGPEIIDENVDPYLTVSSIRFFTGVQLFNVEINREERYVLFREDQSVK